MCSCEPGYLCPRCAGTPDDPGYVDDEQRDDSLQARSDFADGLTMYDPELPR